MTASAAATELDVRDLAPAQRHATIFGIVARLAPGGSFVLVNDHDPRPLRHQLDDRYPGQFSWTYLQQGPAVWRVEIARMSSQAA